MKKMNLDQTLGRITLCTSIFSFVITIGFFIWYDNANTRIKQLERIILTQNSIKENLNTSITNAGKIDSLVSEKDSLLRKLELQETKIEYYLQQMDTQSNWFIFFVSGVFVLFGFVGFGVFKREISYIEEQNRKDSKIKDDKIHSFEDRFKEFENRYIELDAKILESMITYFSLSAEMVAKDQLFASFALKLWSLKSASEKAQLDKKGETRLEKIVPKVLEHFNNALNAKTFNQKFIEQRESINQMIDNILKTCDNPKVREILIEIRYRTGKIE